MKYLILGMLAMLVLVAASLPAFATEGVGPPELRAQSAQVAPAPQATAPQQSEDGVLSSVILAYVVGTFGKRPACELDGNQMYTVRYDVNRRTGGVHQHCSWR